MLTWDEAKQAVHEAQSTDKDDFQRHLADYVVQGVIDKLIEDYVKITMDRYKDSNEELDLDDMEFLMERVAHEAAIFMTGVQVGWYLAEHAHKPS